jgi:hypothetical protein
VSLLARIEKQSKYNHKRALIAYRRYTAVAIYKLD